MKKGQLGVEFFLVLSVVVAFVVILYATSSSELTKTRALNDALISKSSVESLSDGVDFAFLSGAGTVFNKELLVSKNSNCFFLSPSPEPNRFYCTISSEVLGDLFEDGVPREQVFGKTLVTPRASISLSASCHPLTGGWYSVRIEKLATGIVSVSCVELGG